LNTVHLEVEMAITDEARPLLAERESEFALAATPIGALAHAIDAYRQAVAVRIGKNAAHHVEPHCMLAWSCHAYPSSLRCYQRVLDTTVANRRAKGQRRTAVVTALVTNNVWHGLEIESTSLVTVAKHFSARATTVTGGAWIAPEDGLRLVLARGFDPADHDALTELAHRIVDPALAAEWAVGLWECCDGMWRGIR
jgi:hypothetical protein